MRLIRSGATFANVTSVLALVVAMAGTSYAAANCPAEASAPPS